MTNHNKELVNSIPSKCDHYDPVKSKPTGVKCEKLGMLYRCRNHSGEVGGCLFCDKYIQQMKMVIFGT
jgi:hypothetical protein